jgi:hypothetical protein
VTGSGNAAVRQISVVDAVCCVYFCAAGKSPLLVAILDALGVEILIPEEVETEVLGKVSYGQLAVHWPRLKASARVQVLPRLVVEDARAEVVAHVARIRRTSAKLALSCRKDLGEAVVLGHARHLADQGHEVYVLLDDQGGQSLASIERLEIITVEQLLLAAVKLDLIRASDLERTYNRLRPFGAGLPTWKASTLKADYTAWRRGSGPSR